MRLDSAQRRLVLSHPAGWIASGFGAGFSPFASGTAGSAVALVPWFLLRDLSPALWLALIAVAFVIGVWASHVVVQRLHLEDPGVIVWDEFVGQWITLWPLLLWPSHVGWVAAGFFLFRLFDVWKPWPVSWADGHVKGGFGAMLDDVLAGIYAALVLAALLELA
jgi:phosphatidylglycerophosphatase A